MSKQWQVLITSQLEHRRALVKILDGLPINVISSSTLEEAHQVLDKQSVDLMFCDEFLPDGSFEDLLALKQTKLRLVVLTRIGEWEEYLDATRRGAFDVIRCPLQATDVELAIIRAMREDNLNAPQRAGHAAA